MKRRVRPTLGFKSMDSARIILDGNEMVHTMGNQQGRLAFNPQPPFADQSRMLAA